MNLNPFGTVGDYPKMLLKISSGTFFVSLAAISLLRTQIPHFDDFLRPLNVQVTVVESTPTRDRNHGFPHRAS